MPREQHKTNSDPSSAIDGAERLTSVFGYWPSFHDAEVIEIRLRRGVEAQEMDDSLLPSLTAVIHVWEMTDAVDAKGYYVLRHHTLAKLCFEGLHEDELELAGFNHQNVLSSLHIEVRDPVDKPTRRINVRMNSCYGLGANFSCARVALLEAKPCDERGVPLPTE